MTEPTYSELNSARNAAKPLTELEGVVNRLSTEATFAVGMADSSLNSNSTSFKLVMNKAKAARAKADAILADDRIYPDGRKRLAAEEIEKARLEINEDLDRLDAQITVMEATLLPESLPKVQKGEELTARQDLGMLLAAKAGDTQFLTRLAQRDDSIAGLLLSDLGPMLLEAHGVEQKTAEDLHRSLRLAAAQSAATSKTVDVKRQKAAQAFVAVQRLRGAKAAAQTYVRTVLGS